MKRGSGAKQLRYQICNISVVSCRIELFSSDLRKKWTRASNGTLLNILSDPVAEIAILGGLDVRLLGDELRLVPKALARGVDGLGQRLQA